MLKVGLRTFFSVAMGCSCINARYTKAAGNKKSLLYLQYPIANNCQTPEALPNGRGYTDEVY